VHDKINESACNPRIISYITLLREVTKGMKIMSNKRLGERGGFQFCPVLEEECRCVDIQLETS